MTLTIYRDMLQGTDEWFKARRGMLTASTIGALLTPTGKPADNAKSRGLVASLVAERMTDWEDPFYENGDMARGNQVEPIARSWYEQDRSVIVEQVGFMVRTLDDGTKLGYSPDGLVGDDGLIEVKGPRGKNHVQWFVDVFDGKEVADHMPQCQAGMYVSGRPWCDFISYLGGEPVLVTRVHADPDWFDAIEKAAKGFEVKAAEMADKYRKATAGLPRTDKLPDPYDVELRLA